MEKNLSLEQLNNVAEIEIVYRRKVDCKIADRPRIIKSSDAYEILMHYWNEDKIELLEEFKVLFINHAHRVLQIFTLSGRHYLNSGRPKTNIGHCFKACFLQRGTLPQPSLWKSHTFQRR